MFSFGKSEQRKGRLGLSVFKLDRRSTLFNQEEDDLPDFIWARHVDKVDNYNDEDDIIMTMAMTN